MTSLAPGPWLRLCALLAAAGTLVAVVSGGQYRLLRRQEYVR